MIALLLLLLVVLIAIIGAPLFCVIAAMALINFIKSGIGILVVPQELAGIVNIPLIYSIPLFAFAGYLLAHSKASIRLVRLTKAAIGWIPGGLPIVTLITCALFTAFTGASGITIVALGGFLLPALLSENYKEKFSLGLVTSSGSIGLLFPPSLPLILFGVIAGASIDKLFVAGIIPGIVIILTFSVFSIIVSVKQKIPTTKFDFKELTLALNDAKFELPLPILLFLGIYSGKMAISDAAAFTCLYIFIVEMLVLKDIKFKELPKIMKESMVLVGAILIILACSLAATNFLIDQQVPQKLFDSIKDIITNKWTFLIVLNIFLLIVGCLMDIFSALVIIVPLILPIAEAYNVNLIHLGIIFLTNLEIGYLTPPVGMNLFVASIRFGKSIVDIYKGVVVFIGLSLISLVIITYFPLLSTWFIEKPAIVSQWEYTYEDGNVDRIIVKNNGVYLRKKGSLMDIMMDDPYIGKYEIKNDKITLYTEEGKEEYNFELYNDGKKLMFETLSFKKEQRHKIFYNNLINPPLHIKEANLIGKWQQNDDFIEFYFNGHVNLSLNNEDQKDYRYRILDKKKLEFKDDETNTKLICDYKFELNKLKITINKKSYLFDRGESGSDL
ncbi:MAG: hypothetical protein A2086_14630 [Spirochaetes bacterium GWD1_27_9]|nr:MAG: hypothetical protein A2Z98_04770 [Spirochaetes bacterium GWB1_27_13]OHD24953.1 MAG: hypothetical protein A2Y34_06235 [Spirochaetes bacterium GWC1_27_15]OHD38543.1 MAG: hypothetical protein A2086_14630 [Spirochaetes bacterium GWD1_27_9]